MSSKPKPFSFFPFLSPFYHHGNSINVAASFENFFTIQLIHSMLKNSSHSIQKLMNVPSVIRIRNCLHQKRFPFDFSGAIDCVTKSQYLLDSISSTCTFSIFFGIFKLFFFSLSFKKKSHNFRSPETQIESKSGKIQRKTNSLHTIAGLRT